MRRKWRAFALLTLGAVLSQRLLGAQSGAARPDSANARDSLAERRNQEQARAARDGRLVELLHGYEQDRGAIPGTIIPNPLKYDWLADSAQLEFALYVLQQQFIRLEQQLDRLADASRMAMTTTQVPCGPPQGRPSP